MSRNRLPLCVIATGLMAVLTVSSIAPAHAQDKVDELQQQLDESRQRVRLV